MSSLDSQFLCIGTIFSNDIVGHYIGRDRLSDGQQVMLARVFIVLVVAITYILSLQDYRSVFAMGVWCFSGFASLFPLIFAALYWKTANGLGSLRQHPDDGRRMALSVPRIRIRCQFQIHRFVGP